MPGCCFDPNSKPKDSRRMRLFCISNAPSTALPRYQRVFITISYSSNPYKYSVELGHPVEGAWVFDGVRTIDRERVREREREMDGRGFNPCGSWTGIITENVWLMCDFEHLLRVSHNSTKTIVFGRYALVHHNIYSIRL